MKETTHKHIAAMTGCSNNDFFAFSSCPSTHHMLKHFLSFLLSPSRDDLIAGWVIIASCLEWSTTTSVYTVSWTALGRPMAGVCSTRHVFYSLWLNGHICGPSVQTEVYSLLQPKEYFKLYKFCVENTVCLKLTLISRVLQEWPSQTGWMLSSWVELFGS